MIERSATVRNAAGIHCRPATAIVESVKGYEGSLQVCHGGEESDLRSVMGLMSMGLERGERVSIRVSGGAEEEVCRKLVALFETRFDFPPRGGPQPAGQRGSVR